MSYICENCGKEFEEDYRKNKDKDTMRFCSFSCSRQFNGKKNKGVFGHPNYNKNYVIKKYPILEMNQTCCFCNREFNSSRSLQAHIVQCSSNPNYHKKEKTEKWRNAMKNRKGYKQNHNPEGLTYKCNFCERTFSRKESLTVHIRHCKSNPDGVPREASKYIHSEEQNRKNRIAVIKKYEDLGIKFCPNISIKGCDYMDKLNMERGWNLQHGLNGGEIEIDGYFPDGYDKERNIIFEYDEPFHYLDVENNILTEKDLKRQNYLIEKLKCEFYRYNEKKDYFYKVS